MLSHRFSWKKLHLKAARLIDLPGSGKPTRCGRGSRFPAEKPPAVPWESHRPGAAVAAVRGVCKAPVCSAASKHVGCLTPDRHLDGFSCSFYGPFGCVGSTKCPVFHSAVVRFIPLRKTVSMERPQQTLRQGRSVSQGSKLPSRVSATQAARARTLLSATEAAR